MCWKVFFFFSDFLMPKQLTKVQHGEQKDIEFCVKTKGSQRKTEEAGQTCFPVHVEGSAEEGVTAVIRALSWCSSPTTAWDKHTIIILERLHSASASLCAAGSVSPRLQSFIIYNLCATTLRDRSSELQTVPVTAQERERWGRRGEESTDTEGERSVQTHFTNMMF